jgi:DedD protein
MRDVEQMREKYELSLDGRQIAALAIGALVLLSCVFALGLGLGRRLGREQAAAADLDALDAQAEPVVTPKPKPAEKPAPKPAERADAPPPPAAPSAPPVEPPPHATAASPDAVVVAPAAKEPLVVPPPPRAPTTQVSAIVLTPPPHDPGAFTVQIGASPDAAEAQRLENKARGAGLRPYVVKADLGAKGTWYRVRVGSFADKDSAARFRKDVERELRSSAVVMPTK